VETNTATLGEHAIVLGSVKGSLWNGKMKMHLTTFAAFSALVDNYTQKLPRI
jgi:hypothetical protein